MSARRRTHGEGSTYQRASDGRWVGSLRHEDPISGATKRTTVYGTSEREVVGKLREIRKRLDAGTPAKDAGVALDTYATRWIGSTLAASDRKASTRQLYAGLTRTHIIGSDIGKLGLKKISPPAVERFVLALRKSGKSESTVRQVYTIGRAILDAAVRDGLIARNPFAVVKRPKVTAKESTYLSPTELSALLESAKGSRYRPVFELLANTGMRRGEAMALRWSDVDLTNHLARVRGTLTRVDGELVVTPPKSARSHRTIPLSAGALAVLKLIKVRQAHERLHAGSAWVDTGYVFTTEAGGPCDPRNALRALKVAATKAKLEGVGLHTLRHSAASVMLSNGVPLKVVSELLGHSGISITADVYGHVSPDVSRSAVDVLGAALADGA
jgi:integrase